MLKILFFCPAMTIRQRDTTTPGCVPPLGLASVAAYLEVHGYSVAIIDVLAEGLNTIIKAHHAIRVGLTPNQIVQKIKYYQPDIIGVSSMFTAFATDAYEITKLAKKVNPKILTILGGSHASILPKVVLSQKSVDLVVIGEGEETMLEIAQKLSEHQNVFNIAGTATRDSKGNFILNPNRPHISDLNQLPPPARHLLPMDIYLNTSRDASSYAYRTPSTEIITSRGCPGNCIYCAVPGIWGRIWRPYSAERIVEEIQSVIDRYGVREIHFLDDNISVSRERLEKICDLLIAKKIDIKWTTPNGIAIWTLDRPLLEKMKKSGCYRLTFGIESGHPETQKFIRKNLDLKKVKEIIKTASDIGLWIFSTYIIGFPYETKNQIKTTFKYAIQSYSDFVVFILLIPFPQTDVTKIMLQENIIHPSQLSKNHIGELFSGYVGAGNKYFSAAELHSLRNIADKKLMINRLLWPLTHPLAIIRKIHNREDFFYLLRITKNLLTMFFSQLKFGELKTHRLQAAKKYQIIK
ncbi:MAG: radical SAM protein [Candidatus Shapirobacteria bacterium]